MVTKLETEFLFNVEWGELDCLVLDLPPGMATRSSRSRNGSRWRRSDRDDAAGDRAARREARRRDVSRKFNVPVLGVVENMSYYLWPQCNHRHEIFAHGGGERLAHSLDVPFLGQFAAGAGAARGRRSGESNRRYDPRIR